MAQEPGDPRVALRRLFGEDADADKRSSSPFGEEPVGTGPHARLRSSITRLRILRSQAGSDGLTPAATRSLLDELLVALEAIIETLPASEDRGAQGED